MKQFGFRRVKGTALQEIRISHDVKNNYKSRASTHMAAKAFDAIWHVTHYQTRLSSLAMTGKDSAIFLQNGSFE